jgi:hypothetical protein
MGPSVHGFFVKRPHDPPAKWQHFNRNRLVSGPAPVTIDGLQEVEHLAADRRIRLKRQPVEVHRQSFNGSMGRPVQQPGFEFQIPSPFDFNVGVPAVVAITFPRSASTSVAD